MTRVCDKCVCAEWGECVSGRYVRGGKWGRRLRAVVVVSLHFLLQIQHIPAKRRCAAYKKIDTQGVLTVGFWLEANSMCSWTSLQIPKDPNKKTITSPNRNFEFSELVSCLVALLRRDEKCSPIVRNKWLKLVMLHAARRRGDNFLIFLPPELHFPAIRIDFGR